MNNSKRYYGVLIFVVAVILMIAGVLGFIIPKFNELKTTEATIISKEEELSNYKKDLAIVQDKIRRIQNSISTSQKKIYSPIEAELGNETLFFTLYNDVIEMLHSNSIKIKSIDYNYNPEADKFVQFGKDVYFVCDINMEIVSNYINLGKLIQDLYQYPYYVKINELDVRPYVNDKKILLSRLSLRMYAHTAPQDETRNLLNFDGQDTTETEETAPVQQ